MSIFGPEPVTPPEKFSNRLLGPTNLFNNISSISGIRVALGRQFCDRENLAVPQLIPNEYSIYGVIFQLSRKEPW
jgi:hypothetical protein